MAYLKNKHLANIKKWNLDLSLYNDGVYKRYIEAPKDIKEFKGFKELFGFEIKGVEGGLYFNECSSLTSVSNLPEKIKMSLDFRYCKSLISVSNFPEKINEGLNFTGCFSLTSISNLPKKIVGGLSLLECTSLTSISKMPSVVKGFIFTYGCPLFEGMDEEQIREKYGILKE